MIAIVVQMPLERTGYQLCFEELCPGNPVLGSVSIVPWDSEIFGFPVAVYRIGAERLEATAREEFVERFRVWARQNRVSLCACTIPADESHSFSRCSLNEAGFHFVDFSLQAALNSLQKARLPKARAKLRAARPDDYKMIEAIATRSFRTGRYHADPLFPRELADKRYCQWMRNALAAQNPIDHVYVLGELGFVQGFFHITQEEDFSDLRLVAIAPELKGTVMGFEIYVSVLNLLRGRGIRRVMSVISATNTAVMNVHAMLGFSFSAPEMIFHWHAEGSQS
jgi:hypothetical protein